ncbi:OLC1v1028525C2 [Oldenlandia corymbosa var. corymbosa]|nr:OLC1v1028525C2 [Oldenlandia corymbosa var. corymbosa]
MPQWTIKLAIRFDVALPFLRHFELHPLRFPSRFFTAGDKSVLSPRRLPLYRRLRHIRGPSVDIKSVRDTRVIVLDMVEEVVIAVEVGKSTGSALIEVGQLNLHLSFFCFKYGKKVLMIFDMACLN